MIAGNKRKLIVNSTIIATISQNIHKNHQSVIQEEKSDAE